MNFPSDSHLTERQGLAELLFKGLRHLKELNDGFAFGYTNPNIWTTRIAEFIRLEQLAYNAFQFEITFEQNLVWMQWRGDMALIKQELKTLSPKFHPLGKVTLLKDEPLVSVILLADQAVAVDAALTNIFEQVRPPVQIVIVDPFQKVNALSDTRVKVVNSADQKSEAAAFQRGMMESNGGIVAFMNTQMPPALLPLMIEKMPDYHVAIAAGKQPSWVEKVMGGAVSDFMVLRRAVFNKIALIPDAPLEAIVIGARKNGLKVVEIPYENAAQISVMTALKARWAYR